MELLHGIVTFVVLKRLGIAQSSVALAIWVISRQFLNTWKNWRKNFLSSVIFCWSSRVLVCLDLACVQDLRQCPWRWLLFNSERYSSIPWWGFWFRAGQKQGAHVLPLRLYRTGHVQSPEQVWPSMERGYCGWLSWRKTVSSITSLC